MERLGRLELGGNLVFEAEEMMGGLDCSALPGIHNHLLLCSIMVVLNNQALINCPSGCDFQAHGLKLLPYSNIFLGVGLFERSGI